MLNKKANIYLSIIITLMLEIGFSFMPHLAFYNIAKAVENITSETSSAISENPEKKKDIEQNSEKQVEENITSDEGKEKYFGRYKYIRDEGLVRDWEDKSYKEIIVTIRVWIDPSGKVAKSKIAKSCGNSELDQLVLDSAKKRFFGPGNDGQTRIGLIELDLTRMGLEK